MVMIAPRTSVAARQMRVRLQNPAAKVPTADGGYTHTWIDLIPPAMSAQLRPATEKDMERHAGSTTIAHASFVVTMPFHPEVTTETRILIDGGRVLAVLGANTPDSRMAESVLLCSEKVN